MQNTAETNHEIDWENVIIKDRESNTEKRKFIETANILFHPDNLNIKSDFKNCEPEYVNILKKFV